MTYRITLTGCTPTPLAQYLKALGILRLIGEQKDFAARCCWAGEHFVLESSIDRAGLERFFLEEYCPMPLLAPWGARSGFYPGSSESSAREALNAIVIASEKGIFRLATFAAAIQRVRDLLRRHRFIDKPKDADKLTLLKLCRAEFPDAELPWLDACYVLTANDRQFPPLLGTGGNEGSGSYVSGFAQQVVACLVQRKHDGALVSALFEDAVPAAASNQTFGQFSPQAAGGPNMGTGFDSELTTNPWDYLLALEGTLAFAAAATRRLDADAGNQFAFPFTVQTSPAGHGGMAFREDKKARAELWLPLWTRPIGWRELQTLLTEGRATVGRRPARDGLDFSRAVAGLGVDRGVSAFQRHAILERLGQNNLAIPLGRLFVRSNPDVNLISELERGGFLDRLRRFARQDEAPGRIRSLVKRLEDCLFRLTQQTSPRVFQDVLRLLGMLQYRLGQSKKGRDAVPTVPLLSEIWALKAYDGSAEFRIALALAGLNGAGMPMRVHLAPVKPQGGWYAESRLAVWGEGSLEENLTHVLHSRMLETARRQDKDKTTKGFRDKPLGFGCGAFGSDVAIFLAGGTDDARIADLLAGLSLARLPRALPTYDTEPAPLPADYRVLKSFFTPDRILGGLHVLAQEAELPLYPEIPARLAADRPNEVLALAWARLRQKGVSVPAYPKGAPSTFTPGPRLLAALMIPLDYRELAELLRPFAARAQKETLV